MSWDFCNNTVVKRTRKPHRCEFCGRIIPAGTSNILHWSGKFEGDFQSSYACNWCEDNEKHLVDEMDNEILDFSECLKEDLFCGEIERLGESVYYKPDGDYFTFKSYETDKELLRIKCPIKRKVG